MQRGPSSPPSWGPATAGGRYHETVYLIAWDWGSHAENKPRVGFWFKEEHRPWFYGMYSENHDPAYYQPIIDKAGR